MLDYAAVAAFLNAPMVFGFQGTPAAIVYWLAGIHLLMTGFTDFPYGLFKMIPFRVHGVIDLLAGIFLLVCPWLFGFSTDSAARNFFLAMGILILIIAALTDFSMVEQVPAPEPGDRRQWRGGSSR